MRNLQWLQKFYLSNCDKDWEHSYGIKIDTLDNPGWRLEIDLYDTLLEKKIFEEISIERNENNWINCKIDNKQFNAAGGVENLDEIIGIFREWVEEMGYDVNHLEPEFSL